VRPDQDEDEDGKPVECRLQVCWESEPHEQAEGMVKWTYCSGMVWGATAHNSGARANKHTIEADRLNPSTASK
jgi:hypothetical protein